MEDQLRRLEGIVEQLEQKQEESKPFLHIAKDCHSLVKLQQILAGFKKTNNGLEFRYHTNQQSLEDVRKKTNLANRHAKTWVEAEHHKREELQQKIDYKLAELEKDFKKVEKKNTISIQGIEEKLRNDISNMIANAKNKFNNDRRHVKHNLDEAGRY